MPTLLASGWFMQLVGVYEVLGGLGLSFPGSYVIWPALKLVIIMIGGTVLSLPRGIGIAAVPMNR